jgi:hypothetical protein
MKIRTVGAELFPADGQTDGRTNMTKLIVTFAVLRKRLNTKWCGVHTDVTIRLSRNHDMEITVLRKKIFIGN